MQYVGIHTQQVRNNAKSLLLLILFPCIILAMVYGFLAFVNMQEVPDGYQSSHLVFDSMATNEAFVMALPWVVGIVGIWFMISYFSNTSIVRQATGARPLERRENPRIYNIVENLTMTCGMPMPKINIIDDPQLNAFASGIDEKSYTVTVTTGICNRLNDDELAGVIGHELTHIRNRDTRLLIVSIIFVGIMSTVLSLAVRLLWNVHLRWRQSPFESRWQEWCRSHCRHSCCHCFGSCGLFLHAAHALCHQQETRIHGRRGRCRALRQSLGACLCIAENQQRPRAWQG